MYILLTNDDGIDSVGLLALKQSLQNIAEIAVIAPNRNWSISGHTKTMDRPLRVNQVTLPDGDTGYSTDGAPSDCVSLGVLGLLPRVPDLVVSGINKGANIADDITYSGTVAAAMEGVISGVPSIAISLASEQMLEPEWNFSYAAKFAQRLVEQVMERGIEHDVLLNVNVPNIPEEEIVGTQITHVGRRIYSSTLVSRKDPFGRDYYWLGNNAPPSGHMDAGSDYVALQEKCVSVTPIHLDLTNHKLIDELKRWNL